MSLADKTLLNNERLISVNMLCRIYPSGELDQQL